MVPRTPRAGEPDPGHRQPGLPGRGTGPRARSLTRPRRLPRRFVPRQLAAAHTGGNKTMGATGCSRCTPRARTSSGTRPSASPGTPTSTPSMCWIFPEEMNPLLGTPVWDKMTLTERDEYRLHHASCIFSQSLHGQQGAPSRRGQDHRVGAGPGLQVLRGHPGHGRSPARRAVQQVHPGQDRHVLPGQQRPGPAAVQHAD